MLRCEERCIERKYVYAPNPTNDATIKLLCENICGALLPPALTIRQID